MPPKDPSPLVGYNNNVRHKKKVFHIQTEDSGFKYAHVVTHLFMDGGRVLKRVKTSYAEFVGDARVGEIVREMMKQQHKAMFIALRDGEFDSIVEGGSVPPPPPSRVMPSSVPPPPATVQADAIDELPVPAKRPAAPGLALDADALERAAAAASVASPVLAVGSQLPPPPPDLLGATAERGLPEALPPPPMPPPPVTGDGAERRYAPTRPASIFGQPRPTRAPGKSFLGADLISDKSLDEVILSYLAGEPESDRGPEKK
jgi:hypothetical protein